MMVKVESGEEKEEEQYKEEVDQGEQWHSFWFRY